MNITARYPVNASYEVTYPPCQTIEILVDGTRWLICTTGNHSATPWPGLLRAIADRVEEESK